MRHTVRSLFSIALFVSCTLANFVSSVSANEVSLSEAFEKADPSKSEVTKILYDIEGCKVKRTIVNINYCGRTGQGNRDRLIVQNIDLNEVHEIRVSRVRGKFYLRFGLDYGGPGFFFILYDRIKNGKEGAFERFSERSKVALKSADLNSGTTFSHCDGSPPTFETKQMTLALITKFEPEGWLRIVDLAKKCRSPKHLEFIDE